MFERVREIICTQLGLDEERVTEASSFADDLCCDSLDVVELLATAEDEFGMPDIPEEKLAELKTVGDLVAYISETMQEG